VTRCTVRIYDFYAQAELIRQLLVSARVPAVLTRHRDGGAPDGAPPSDGRYAIEVAPADAPRAQAMLSQARM
jgi:hypothetical protein